MRIKTLSTSILVTFLALTGCGDGTGDDDVEVTPTEAPSQLDMDKDGYSSPMDCDDNDAQSNPGAAETCDNKDNNCNSQVDEGFVLTWYYPDADQDGYGNAALGVQACSLPTGYLANGGDCDDTTALVRPGLAETPCNGIDENCSGAADDSPDMDLDGYDLCTAGVPGADALAPDCNDASAQMSPGAVEVCNKQDDNCNGQIDEGLSSQAFYQDLDSDGYGNEDVTVNDCAAPPGYVAAPEDGIYDCDDTEILVHPGAQEQAADGLDSNCNGFNDWIESWAGKGYPGYSGDGGHVSESLVNAPQGVAIDPQGNLFIADTGNNVIRKVDPTGLITTIAGSGKAGFADGYFTDAMFNAPCGVTADGAGGIFIADTGNHRVRKLERTGQVLTVAGNGTAGYNGDGITAIAAQLNEPFAVAMDTQQALVISDSGNHRIRQVETKGNLIKTIAGTGTAGYGGDDGPATAALLNSPMGIVVDITNVLYIADSGNHLVRKVFLTGTAVTKGQIKRVAGIAEQAGYTGDMGGALFARLNTPMGVATDAYQTLYIADYGNNRLRQVTVNGTITTITGTGDTAEEDLINEATGSAYEIDLNQPTGVAIVPKINYVAIADSGWHRVRVLLW